MSSIRDCVKTLLIGVGGLLIFGLVACFFVISMNSWLLVINFFIAIPPVSSHSHELIGMAIVVVAIELLVVIYVFGRALREVFKNV